jgi:hypothetical protein
MEHTVVGVQSVAPSSAALHGVSQNGSSANEISTTTLIFRILTMHVTGHEFLTGTVRVQQNKSTFSFAGLPAA